MDYAVILECLSNLMESEVVFPKAVERLRDAEVGDCSIDFVSKRMVVRGVYGTEMDMPFALDNHPPVGERFDVEAIKQSVECFRAQEIGYMDYLREIISAGARNYVVDISGSQEVYRGGDGVSHAEPFPSQPTIL